MDHSSKVSLRALVSSSSVSSAAVWDDVLGHHMGPDPVPVAPAPEVSSAVS